MDSDDEKPPKGGRFDPDEDEDDSDASSGEEEASGGAGRKRARAADSDDEDDDTDGDEEDGSGSDEDGSDNEDEEEDKQKKKKKAPAKGKATPAKGKAAAAKAAPKAAAKGKAAASAGKAKATPGAKAPAAKGKAKAPPAKKVKTESGAAASSSSSSSSSSAGEAKPKRAKELKPAEMVEMAMKAFRWWEATPLPKGIKWRTIEHRGVCFPPAYVPHGVRMKYGGEPVSLTPEQEEVATMYATMPPDGPQLGTPDTAAVFNDNFFRDFRALLGKDHVIQKLSLCDFDPIRAHLAAQREKRQNASTEEKEATKTERAAAQLKYGFALVDNHLEKMGNYTVEPPGLFRGRGKHPKMGTLKRRVQPEEITINVGDSSVVPPCPLPGHAWKRVVHDPTVTWLAYWKENVMGGHKYVFLAASSSFKGKSDLAKYEKARKLKTCIASIRAHYEKLLQSSDAYERQSGTAMWIIDRLALRVGGEKDEDEADTVGCCSLRAEHLSFPDGNTSVTLDFLGKDSMRYFQTINLEAHGHIGKLVLSNLKGFCKNKRADEDVFSELTPTRLNEQLSDLMPGLSAKVFRTYNASVTLEAELELLSIDTKEAEKVLEYNRANREVAILCNHQRTVPRAFQENWDKLTAREALLEKQLAELREMAAALDKKGGVRLKSEDAKKGEKAKSELDAAAKKELAKRKKDKAPENDTERLMRIAEEESHMFSTKPEKDSVVSRITAWEAKLDKLKLEMRNKDENKTVALGTSKINYMDPRITVAWCKKVELPIERVFQKALQDKFPWAMGAPSSFKF